MSILIQAGHQTSYSNKIIQELYERGLSQPLDSFSYKMTPQQISSKLYQVILQDSNPLASSKLKDTIMIDLLLSNLEVQNWGWESPENLYVMDCWSQIVGESKFILVFDHPSYAIDDLISANFDISVDSMDNTIEEWIKYHELMLEVLDKYTDNILLIEGRSIINNFSDFGSHIESITQGLSLKSHWQTNNFVNRLKKEQKNTTINLEENSNYHIVLEVLKNYPRAIKIFNRLLDKAKMKISQPIFKTKQTSKSELIQVLSQLNQSKSNQQELSKKIEYIEELESQLSNSTNLVNQYKSKLDSVSKENKKLSNCASFNNSEHSIKQENEMLINQLHHTQEKLERYYLLNQKYKQGDLDSKPIPNSNKNPSKYGAAERVKQDLPYRLGATMVNHSNSPKKMAMLPISLIQEYYDFRKNSVDQSSLPSLDDYEDRFEAEKVKKHLSYKLGVEMQKVVQKPIKIITAPIGISKAILEFKLLDKKKNNK